METATQKFIDSVREWADIAEASVKDTMEGEPTMLVPEFLAAGIAKMRECAGLIELMGAPTSRLTRPPATAPFSLTE